MTLLWGKIAINLLNVAATATFLLAPLGGANFIGQFVGEGKLAESVNATLRQFGEGKERRVDYLGCPLGVI
jgi:hypothetical protein